MRNVWILRALAVVVIVALTAWIVHNTAWVEVDVDEPLRGAAATDEVYSLRKVLEASGTTLEVRKALEPLPPANATLVLNSTLWDVFPERDGRLKAWVEAGGHLVVHGAQMHSNEHLKWIPLGFAAPPHRAASAATPGRPASDAEDEDDEDEDGDAPPPTTRRRLPRGGPDKLEPPKPNDKNPWLRNCVTLEETSATTQPAFEAGRDYRGCMLAGPLRPLGATPTWLLAGVRGTAAMRVPLGRGSVTATAVWPVFDNRGLLQADNALIASAILQAAPGRAVWFINDESREPLLLWLWHQARAPLLLCVAAVLLALWRLMVRFGPRQALPPRARRSMGEQVHGTGQFIAGTDPQALHAATRKAFDDVARTRVEHYAELDDSERIIALAAVLAPATVLDKVALMGAFKPAPLSPTAPSLAAIAVIEQARRALLRTPASAAPPASPAATDTP
ncbi:MAG: DUF4350 domain-containing protein [Betaproteobacteria bacterium]